MKFAAIAVLLMAGSCTTANTVATDDEPTIVRRPFHEGDTGQGGTTGGRDIRRLVVGTWPSMPGDHCTQGGKPVDCRR